MTDSEWAELRQRLCSQFPEDTVQTVLLRLWEFLDAGGVLETEPIYWCRTVAYRHKLNAIRDEKHDYSYVEGLDNGTSNSPEQELVLLEQEVLDRLSKPVNARGKPLTREAAAMRKIR